MPQIRRCAVYTRIVHSPFSDHLIILLTEPMAAMIAVLYAVADTTYTAPLQLAQAMHDLHMSEILGYDNDGAEYEGKNDIHFKQEMANPQQ